MKIDRLKMGTLPYKKGMHCLVTMFIVTIVLLLISGTGGCAMDVKKIDNIGRICFTPDGKKIVFDRTNDDSPNMIHVYDLETGELSAYQSPTEEVWHIGGYAFDGKRIVITTGSYKDKKYDIYSSTIAIMDPDGQNIRTIVRTPDFKVDPSFSHSGRKIIFIRAGMIRKSGRTPAADYDVYEVDIESGRETRLTYFRFFLMSPPHYFPDDTTFTFSGEYPCSFSGVPDSDRDRIKKMRDELLSKYQENTIFVMRQGEATLKPYIEFGRYSSRPLLSADGSRFLFRGWAHKADGAGDGEQFYLYSPDGKHKRITYLNATSIWSSAVSPDGEQLAIVYHVAPHREIKKLVVYRVSDGSSKEITLPNRPSRIINQPKG